MVISTYRYKGSVTLKALVLKANRYKTKLEEGNININYILIYYPKE